MKDEEPGQGRKLPVTAEVGGEGGSYADATMQAETFSGPEGNPRADPRVAADVDGRHLAAAVEGEPVLDDGAVVKHATEPPERRKP
jgi:hypothetical protein